MKVMVLGGAGYIGSHVVKEMIKAGHQVTVFDNMSSGREENLFDESAFIKGDILEPINLAEAFASDDFDAVVHLAAFKAAGESMVRPEKYSVNNITGTINILNAMCDADIKKIVFSSSAAIFGEPVRLPIDEDHPKNPENYYGFTKLEIERFLGWYDKLKGIKFAALRYFNAAGYDVDGEISGLEQSPANLLPVIMEAAAGMRDKLQIFGDDYETKDGTGVRDYVHVSDLAAGHVMALNYISDKNESLTVNLGSENGLSVLELLEEARKISGKEIPAEIVGRRPGDPAKLVASSAKAKEKLGWVAKYSDCETLIKTSWEVYKGRLDKLLK
ncbi:MAG TPA: UDP-glucose 4-epimerase GalE [Spirochaeta sp.]|nr:UDP-glucose 4-epimerase GalE [Spirochaeta sp.]